MTTTTETTEPNRGGAPEGNRNRTTHGIRGWLAIGSLPKGASYVRRLVGQLRTQLESAVLEVHGEITVYSAALIQSAARHEGRALLLTRWLRDEANLKLVDRLAVLKEVGAATDARDKCLKGLGLDVAGRARDPWSEFDYQAALDASVKPANDKGTDHETKTAAPATDQKLPAGNGHSATDRTGPLASPEAGQVTR